ncbi:MAG: phytanoyl-CoA dioxygenase family protein [Chloroflexi bacterium]|nr:phytanoyl-CoA dioxygenase family protein [Chloroflexota bacterium]
MRLAETQTAEFHREGYLVVEEVFGPEDLQPVRHEITRAIDRNAAQLVEAGELSRTYAEEPFDTRLTRITAETDKVYWSLASGKLHGTGIFKLLTNPKLLDLVETLVGPEIIASSAYRLRPKVPGFAHGVVPWHQDSGYFEPYCDKALIVTVWIPLVDATPERGCLSVMPRVHGSDVYRHHRHESGKYLAIAEDAFPNGEVVVTPVPLGGALLLSNRTPHCSGDNVTDVIRWSMDLRYQSADLPTNHHAPSGWANDDLPPDAPIACYPPEADFLVRSRQRPHDVVRRWRDFRDLRVNHQRMPVSRRWGE